MVVTTRTAAMRRHGSKAVYTARSCGECGDTLPPKSSVNRVLCDRCRSRRRGITFLRKASEVLEAGGLHAEVGEIETLVGRLELAR